MKTPPTAAALSAIAHYCAFLRSLLRGLFVLPLLVLAVLAQTTTRLGLEQSTDLQLWEAVPVAPEMLDADGKILPATDAVERSYRLQINILPAPAGGPPPSSPGTPLGTKRLALQQSTTLTSWTTVSVTPSMLDASGKIQLSTIVPKSFYRLDVTTSPSGPTILVQPSSPGTYSGSPVTLTISVSGGETTPHTYEWFQGNPGDTTTPVGTTYIGSFTTPPLPTTTTFWVRVTDGSGGGGSVDSDAVTVTVTPSATLDAFALIPAGSFTMGNTIGDADITDAAPVSVTVSAFYMGKYEVTKYLWDTVRTWGHAHGYTDIALGAEKYPSHPVTSVTWFDAVQWCNARSEMEGLTPVYTLGGVVIRSTNAIGNIPTVNWSANGYRLPTEAEWEKAARGGLLNQRFPWGNTITHGRANYSSDTEYEIAYDTSLTRGYHPTYNDGLSPLTSPGGSFSANGYGVHDMAGNVMEWCWDGYSASAYLPGTIDPKGSAEAYPDRVLRGGNWIFDATYCRVAARVSGSPQFSGAHIGFRLARSEMSAPVITAQPGSTTVLDGGTTTLTVAASGTEPLFYQWYRGSVGDTTTPVGANAASFTTPALSATTIYWVRASNATGGMDSAAATVTVAGMALIPGGEFQMGDNFNEGGADERPVHTVNVNAFYMGKYEVTKELWDVVRFWAGENGYTDLPVGGGKAMNHPVHSVSWYEMVKWCNALSQREGLAPCYTIGGLTYKTGNSDAVVCDWNANGYRLPAEAEWEKAARGGLSGARFPLGDTISHAQANYYAESGYSYDLSGAVNNYHPSYDEGGFPYSSPVGSFAPNGYGLYDMAGNVWEWVWDWFDGGYYAVSPSTDPRGPSSGLQRVSRGGGSSGGSAFQSRVANRGLSGPGGIWSDFGFRVARSYISLPVAPTITVQPGSTTVPVGGTTTLTVLATGTEPFTYQWYQGNSGDKALPVGTNAASFTTPALIATTNYWVLVSNTAASVDSAAATVTVADMALIPAGSFTMGDAIDGNTAGDAPPVTVTVSAFSIGKYEVTKALWDEVRNWGASNGYTDLSVGSGKASNHPVHSISWFDMVKWCNARSVKENLTPVYTVSGGATMKTGTSEPTANWSANGYRLPTEAEWEKAAQGGVSDRRFPTGTDTISHALANYYAYPDYNYDLSRSVNNYHPTYATGSFPYTSPVGSFVENAYGLYDMSGNVWEWCWDWYGASAYVSNATNPRGVATGSDRVIRGGGWSFHAPYARSAHRNGNHPTNANYNAGFRVARSLVVP